MKDLLQIPIWVWIITFPAIQGGGKSCKKYAFPAIWCIMTCIIALYPYWSGTHVLHSWYRKARDIKLYPNKLQQQVSSPPPAHGSHNHWLQTVQTRVSGHTEMFHTSVHHECTTYVWPFWKTHGNPLMKVFTIDHKFQILASKMIFKKVSFKNECGVYVKTQIYYVNES